MISCLDGLKNTFNRHARVIKLLILFLVLFSTFTLVYSIHFDYRYPYHADEWQHLAQVVRVIDRGEIKPINPYFKEDKPLQMGLEPGFHTLLAELFMLTGIDPVLNYRFLPALFACISSLMVFVFVYHLSGEYFSGIFAMIFFANLRSNINILGLWFMVPLTASIPLIYLAFFVYVRITEDNKTKFIILFMITILALVLIHPVSVAFMVPIVLLHALLRYRHLKRIFLGLLPTTFIILLLAIVYYDFIWKGSFEGTISFLSDFIVFEHGWGRVEANYPITLLYGVIPTVLAFIGILPALKKKIILPVIWSIYTAEMLWMFSVFKFILFAPYQRMLYYTLFGLVPLSALGLHFTLSSVKSLLKRLSLNHIIVGVCLFFIAESIFLLSFNDYYNPPLGFGLYYPIWNEDYTAIKWLESHYGQKNAIMTTQWISLAVYPTSRNYVVSIIRAQIGGGYEKDVDTFFDESTTCKDKMKILEKNKVDYVLSRKQINCENLKKVFAVEGNKSTDYVYVVEYENTTQK